jgi:hypothetical protein
MLYKKAVTQEHSIFIKSFGSSGRLNEQLPEFLKNVFSRSDLYSEYAEKPLIFIVPLLNA